MKNLQPFAEFLAESAINEGKTTAPINHKIVEDGETLLLTFSTAEECQSAKYQYSDLHPRTTSDKLSLIFPIISVIRYIVNSKQSQPYNPK